MFLPSAYPIALFVKGTVCTIEFLTPFGLAIDSPFNAEARLASALVRDPRLEQAAESIGIKMNTARNHLKRIFNKTGTDRQSSLINLIVSGPAGLIIKTNGK